VKRVATGPVTSNTLRSEFKRANGQLTVVLAGAIDENADLADVFTRLSEDATFNMQGVERVNSMGVHRWIPLVTQASREHRLAIEEISYALVQSANSVANMFGSAPVRSCMAPYFCARCKDNFTVTVRQDEVAAAGHKPPQKQCTQCAQLMEFDELDGYFGFFKNRAVK
jgi:hypothetical protein